MKIKSASREIFLEVLPFIDSLFKALEKVDAKIAPKYDETEVIFKDKYTITLNFKLPCRKINLSTEDERYSTYHTFEYETKGIINVEVGYKLSWYSWGRSEKNINQTKRMTTENLLRKVFVYIFSLHKIIDEEEKAYIIREKQRLKEEEERLILKEKRDNEYTKTQQLINNSLNYFYSKLVQEYVAAEIDEESEEYRWAIEKANWIRDSEKYPDDLLGNSDKALMLSFKKIINIKDEKIMPRPGITAYDILISCPGDVSDYLEVINQSIDNFNRMFGELNNITLVTKHWSKDSYPQSGDKPQELLNKQFVNDCDAAIAIFWTRFGTPTDEYGSGTEEEIEIMLNSDKQVFMYFLDLPINPSEIDMEQYQKVLDFRSKYKEKGIYAVIKDKHELQRELSNHLAMHFIPIISGESVTVNNKEKSELNIRNTEDFSEEFYTVHRTSLLESKFMTEKKEKIIDDIVELKNNSLPSNDKLKDSDIDTEESLKKVEISGIDSKHTELLQSITKGSFYTDVTISEDFKKVIKDFIKANQIIIEDDFWNLGNLKKSTLQLKLAPPFGTGGPTYEGTEAEKGRFKQIKKLYWDIRTYNEYVIYFEEIDKINFLKLAISNNGTTFDEDIDIKFIIPKKYLINYSDLPMPGINIIKELIDIKFIDYIFSIEETESIDEYSGYPNYPLNIPSHLKNPLLLNQRSIEQEYEDHKDEFLSEFEYLFCYRTFENENSDVVLFHVNYLKHNTAMAFPSVLMFKEIPPYIKYEISSKFSTEIIEGELTLNQN